MDQLAAYKILGLEPGSSPEEIKEAYAALSKQYHPEEEPEKFQEIHEAYVTLSRGKRRGSVEKVYREERKSGEEFDFHKVEERKPGEEFDFNKAKERESEEEFNFHKVEIQHESCNEPEFDFDDAMVKAEQQAQEKLHELVLQAVAELKILVSPKYKSNLKAYQAFFEDKKYEPIIRKTEFLEKLCEVLEETKLKKNIYNYIIEFYRLRGMKPSELSPVGLRLYQVLDDKVGIKRKIHSGVYGLIAITVMSIFRALHPVIRESESFLGVILGLLGVFLLVWVFKKLKEKLSALFSQAVITIVLMISQVVVIMFDAYGTIFGSVDAGNTVAAVVLLLAFAWFLVVIFVAIVKAMISVIKRK